MINKIQYLRKISSVGMPGGGGRDPNFVPRPTVVVPLTPNPTISVIQSNPNPTVPTTATIVTNPFVPIIPRAPDSVLYADPEGQAYINISYPTPTNLIFKSVADLTATSNQPLVHKRDAAGNIILVNDTGSNNQLLTIESISYTIPSNIVNNVINTQFNYFKFPPRLSTIEVSDEINLTDTIDEIDTVSTRYIPSATSGRQTGKGRIPELRAGLMIMGSIDDDLVETYRSGYYGKDHESWSILNMEQVVAGMPQLKLSRFIITPDMIESGENIFFKIRLNHGMYGNEGEINPESMAEPPGNGFNSFGAELIKRDGSNLGGGPVVRVGNYQPTAYIDTDQRNFITKLTVQANLISDYYNVYINYLKQYDALLASSDRSNTKDRAKLARLKINVGASKNTYNNSMRAFVTLQTAYVNRMANNERINIDAGSYRYEMLYLVDMETAKPYDEYYIQTRCDTSNNGFDKDGTYWQIVPTSKIKTALTSY